MSLTLDLVIVLLLILANGLFAMVEFALVSARRSRLRELAEAGDAGARAALELADDPNRFLSTVQIGITLIGILAGAFGGTRIAAYIMPFIVAIPWLAPYAGALSIAIVVLAITFLTMVIGELVPKRIGLYRPVEVSTILSRPMRLLSRIAAPAVWLVSGTTDLILRILRIPPATRPAVTEEEIRSMLEEGRRAGILEAAEQDMMEAVFRFGDRRVEALMTPRPEIVALDLDAPPTENWEKISSGGHTWYPVYRSSLDSIAGVITVRDLLSQVMAGNQPDLVPILREPVYVPEGRPALTVLELLRTSQSHIALVTDEYGTITGLLTFHDIAEAILGTIPAPGPGVEPDIVKREDGSYLIEGILPLEELRERLGLGPFPEEGEGFYRTIAGFLVYSLGHIPGPGEHITWNGYRFEVMDMDGKRVDKILLVPPPPPTPEGLGGDTRE
ncbi:MAG TPA: hemolysin family protein [Methanomicrobiales archaeon]|nr:hemolysin family protein [Methanomicrobiales archaeon]